MPTRRQTRMVSFVIAALLSFAAVPPHAGSAQTKPLTGAEQIAQARRQLEALNDKVDAAVEDFNVGTIALAKAQKQAEVAQARVRRSRERLARLKAESGSLAAAAYRGGGAGGFVTLVTTSSPQTFLDRASTLDHLARTKQDQLLALRAANRELRAEDAASEQALAAGRAIAARQAKTKSAIEKDVAGQEALLEKLETDEARRIAAERAAERKRLAALARARAEKARLARIEAARLARVTAATEARLEQEGRDRQAARLARGRSIRAAAAEAAEREAERAAEAAAAAAEAAESARDAESDRERQPAPEPRPDPPREPEPEAAADPPNGSDSRAAVVVRAAHQQLGKRYVWAADGPDTFDCSGLTMYVWAKAGVSLPHSSRAQFREGTRVSQSQLRPGDLVFFGSPIHHVGIFIGGGQYIAAPQTGDVVRIKSMARRDYTGAVRL